MPASTVSIKQICDAIATELGEVLVNSGDLIKSQNYNELTENIADERTLQVYPEEQPEVSIGSETQKLTLGSDPYIHEEFIVHVDFYAKRRANLGEDMALLISGIDAIRENLKDQQCPNPFNLTGLATFQWSWRRVEFTYAGSEVNYIGARFRLALRTF